MKAIRVHKPRRLFLARRLRFRQSPPQMKAAAVLIVAFIVAWLAWQWFVARGDLYMFDHSPHDFLTKIKRSMLR